MVGLGLSSPLYEPRYWKFSSLTVEVFDSRDMGEKTKLRRGWESRPSVTSGSGRRSGSVFAVDWVTVLSFGMGWVRPASLPLLPR